MLVFARKVHDLRHFCFRHFVCEHAALADPVVVDMQHNASRRLAVFVKEALEHVHDEFHRRVVVVEQKDAIQTRPLGLRLGLGDDRRSGAFIALALSIVVRRAWPQSIGRIDFMSLVKSHHDTGCSRRFEGGTPHDAAPMILGQ
jgi:hypothetical protein